MLIRSMQGNSATVSVNGTALSSNVSVGNGKGFVGFGTSGYFPAEFDNFSLTKGELSLYIYVAHYFFFFSFLSCQIFFKLITFHAACFFIIFFGIDY